MVDAQFREKFLTFVENARSSNVTSGNEARKRRGFLNRNAVSLIGCTKRMGQRTVPIERRRGGFFFNA